MYSSSLARARRRALPALILVEAALGCMRAAGADNAPLALEEALRLAESDQPLLESQRAGMRAAEEAKVAAGQLPDPKLKLGLINLPVTGADAFSINQDFMTMRMVGVMQELPRQEKRRLRSRLAEIDGEQRVQELALSRRAIQRDVSTAWVDVLYTLRTLALVHALKQETERQIDSLVIALKAGKATQADVIAARINLELLGDRAAQLGRQEAVARAGLARWIGAAAQRPLRTEAPRIPQLRPLEEMLAQIDQHPHLAAFDKQVTLAETEADLARAGSKPDWSVEVSYGARGPNFSDMVSVQFSIDLPLFQKQRQLRDTASKLATAQRVRAQRADNLREMKADLQRLYAEWRSAVERAQHFRDGVLPQAANRLKAALATYRSGRGDLATVLDARRMELELRTQALMLEAEAAKAQFQIAYFASE